MPTIEERARELWSEIHNHAFVADAEAEAAIVRALAAERTNALRTLATATKKVLEKHDVDWLVASIQAALADAQDALRTQRAEFESLDRVTRGQIARQEAELQTLRANMTACQEDNTRLVLACRAANAERESSYMNYRLKCDEVEKAAVVKAKQAEARLDLLRQMPAGWRMNAAHLSVREVADSMDRWFRDGMPLPATRPTPACGGEQ